MTQKTMTEREHSESVDTLKQQLVLAQSQATKAETLLMEAEDELIELSKNATAHRYDKIQGKLSEMSRENHDLSVALKLLNKKIVELENDAVRWRGRFLLSEIEILSASNRAETAEHSLSEVIKPMPYDQQQLVKERELGWMAFTDPITQIGNSNKLDVALKSTVDTVFSKGEVAALFVIDIDKFRAINTFSGWDGGNQLLKQVAHRMTQQISSDTVIARRAEDEFCVIVPFEKRGAAQIDESPLVRCRQIADFLLKLLAQPFEINHQKFPVTASVGISVCPDDADSPVEMLENAYTALAQAKAKGGSSFVIFSDKVYDDKERRANLAAALKETMAREGLQYLFIPVANVESGGLAGAVVDPYWVHPEHGRLGFHDFMELAEEYGLMPQIVAQMLDAGCELSRKLKGSINIILRFPTSVLSIANFSKHFMNKVNAARIKPSSITLDLPAEALLESQTQVVALYSELGKWGVGRSITLRDNTPVSLLSLQHSGLDLLNLQAETLQSVPETETRRAVLQCYLDMSNRLSIPVLANGVTSASQAHFLALHKCQLASGNFLAPPFALDEFIKRRRATWQFR